MTGFLVIINFPVVNDRTRDGSTEADYRNIVPDYRKDFAIE